MKHHATYLLGLVAILVVGVTALYAAVGNRSLQLVIGLVLAGSYVAWGWSHHAKTNELHPKIMIEYVLIAAIAVVLLLTMMI